MGDNWSREELEAALKAYIEMQENERLNMPYIKNSYYKVLAKRFKRTEKAFEYRMQNISFVFSELGREWINGLLPAKNVGKNIQSRILEILHEIETGDDKVSVVSTLDFKTSEEGGSTINEGTEMSGHNPTIDQLLARGYGGSEAACSPGDHSNEHLVKGKSSPGVDEVMTLLKEKLTGPFTEKTHWVFLVGGPGNGKSFQIDNLVKETGGSIARGGKGAIAKRKYEVPLGDRQLVIVNDATIMDRADEIGDLAHDLKEILETSGKPTFLLVNINRGILIEELHRINGKTGWDDEKEIIEKIQKNETKKYYEHRKIKDESISVHAVYLDLVSSLEEPPQVNGGSIENIEEDGKPIVHKVMKFDSEIRLESPGGSLLSELVLESKFENNGCGECSAKTICPFLANASNLRVEKFRLGFLKILRGVEIISGHLITYRDLWALLSIALLGNPRKEWSSKPCKWVCQKAGEWENKKKKESLLDLFSQRIHLSFFQDGPVQELFNHQQSSTGDNDYINSLKLDEVDPALDVNREWAKKPSHALEGMHVNTLTSNATSLDSIKPYWSKLDLAVEKEIFGNDAWIKDEDDVRRRSIMSAWGASVYRLYGLAEGIPAHLDVIKEWTKLRREEPSCYSPLEDSGKLAIGLKQVLCPNSNLQGANESCLIPIFQHRCEPIRNEVEPTLVYKISSAVDRPTWKIRFRGDSIWIDIYQLNRPNDVICSLLLDFPLCRESMTSANGTGFTELGARATPRLERARAAIIADPKKNLKFGVAGLKFYELKEN